MSSTHTHSTSLATSKFRPSSSEIELLLRPVYHKPIAQAARDYAGWQLRRNKWREEYYERYGLLPRVRVHVILRSIGLSSGKYI